MQQHRLYVWGIWNGKQRTLCCCCFCCLSLCLPLSLSFSHSLHLSLSLSLSHTHTYTCPTLPFVSPSSSLCPWNPWIKCQKYQKRRGRGHHSNCQTQDKKSDKILNSSAFSILGLLQVFLFFCRIYEEEKFVHWKPSLQILKPSIQFSPSLHVEAWQQLIIGKYNLPMNSFLTWLMSSYVICDTLGWRFKGNNYIYIIRPGSGVSIINGSLSAYFKAKPGDILWYLEDILLPPSRRSLIFFQFPPHFSSEEPKEWLIIDEGKAE